MHAVAMLQVCQYALTAFLETHWYLICDEDLPCYLYFTSLLPLSQESRRSGGI